MRASPGSRGVRKLRDAQKLKQPNGNKGILLSGSLEKGAYICFIIVLQLFVVGPDFGLRGRAREVVV